MANPYAYTLDSRWPSDVPTRRDLLDIARIHADHVKYALGKILSTTDADGLNGSVANPLKIEVAAGVIWSLGFWQAADTGWWLLGRRADVASFVRADAEFYIPLFDIADVPAT